MVREYLFNKATQFGAKKLGGLLAPKKEFSSTDWSKELAGQRSALAAAKPAAASRPTLPGEQSMAVPSPTKPVNPATTSPRPAMAVPAPKPPTAPTEPFGGVPDASDPAMVGGRAMLDQRQEEKDTFDYNGSVYRTNPDATASKVSGTGPDRLGPQSREAQINALRQSYLGTFEPTSEERTAQESLATVQSKAAADEAAARQAYAQRVGAINQQATLQPFLTGRQRMAAGELADQLAAVQAATQAQTLPLSTRLAQAQAQREAARQRAEAEIKFATPKAPVEVGGSLVDPETGRVVYQAPRAAEKPMSVSEGQTIIDPATGEVIFRSEKQKEPKIERVGDSLVRVNADGSVEEIYTDASGKTKTKPLTEAQAKNAGFALRMQSATALIDRFGSAAAGFGGAVQSLIPGGALTNWVRSPEYQQLDQAQRDFINAVLRRESGAAISPSEFENAKLQYFPIAGDTPEVIAQKKANREAAIRGVQLGAGATDETMTAPDGAEYIKGEDGLYYPKANGGSAAAGTPAEAKRVASAIGQFESGGNYKALGPILNSGSYKGDRAYGKYQVMGKNIPSWTKEALGKSLTPQQFLADPRAQDAVAEYRMGKLLAQGYGVEDIASIWFSGQPLAKAGNRRDQLGTSVPQYARNVRAIYNRG